MDYIKLGTTGVDVSPIAIGAMTYGDPNRGHPVLSLGEEQSRPLIKHALEAGINFFDTANVYGRGAAETAWGEILSKHPRDSYILATKVNGQMSDDPGDQGLSAAQIAK